MSPSLPVGRKPTRLATRPREAAVRTPQERSPLRERWGPFWFRDPSQAGERDSIAIQGGDTMNARTMSLLVAGLVLMAMVTVACKSLQHTQPTNEADLAALA